ncbi:MAG: hypothetical protein GXP54_07555 [Deltaproteobacteria bacterium]|nr:hypothetical protein [Deltaproteobacteria bacterium]
MARDDSEGESGHDLNQTAGKARARLRARYPDCPPDMIDDAVGDALAQWIERYESLVTPGSHQRMLMRLAEWRLLDRMGSRKRHVPASPEVLERLDDSKADVEANILGRETSRLARSVYLLTGRSRRVLALWSSGYNMREISLRLHLKMVTVRKKKERAIRKLRDRLSRTRAPGPNDEA